MHERFVQSTLGKPACALESRLSYEACIAHGVRRFRTHKCGYGLRRPPSGQSRMSCYRCCARSRLLRFPVDVRHSDVTPLTFCMQLSRVASRPTSCSPLTWAVCRHLRKQSTIISCCLRTLCACLQTLLTSPLHLLCCAKLAAPIPFMTHAFLPFLLLALIFAIRQGSQTRHLGIFPPSHKYAADVNYGVNCSCVRRPPQFWWVAEPSGRHRATLYGGRGKAPTELCRCLHCATLCPAVSRAGEVACWRLLNGNSRALYTSQMQAPDNTTHALITFYIPLSTSPEWRAPILIVHTFTEGPGYILKSNTPLDPACSSCLITFPPFSCAPS